MKISLVGYMGCGKSTIGAQLAQVYDYSFVDLDLYIQEKEGLSIPQIFKTKGSFFSKEIPSNGL